MKHLSVVLALFCLAACDRVDDGVSSSEDVIISNIKFEEDSDVYLSQDGTILAIRNLWKHFKVYDGTSPVVLVGDITGSWGPGAGPHFIVIEALRYGGAIAIINPTLLGLPQKNNRLGVFLNTNGTPEGRVFLERISFSPKDQEKWWRQTAPDSKWGAGDWTFSVSRQGDVYGPVPAGGVVTWRPQEEEVAEEEG
ncbi:hypothetical protein HQ544_03175 [Candidatus Falkowbacteria bacterium]|nr:hypothetical protein [Candidatus Falkowbacteria bacterium]